MGKQEQLILIGGGGHCKSCIDVIEEDGLYEIAGIVDVQEKLKTQVLGYEIMATDNDLSQIVSKYKNVLICIGDIKRRKELFEELISLGANFVSIVSPKAQVSKHTSIAEGTIIFHQTVVNTGARVGKNCIVNNGAILEHDVVTEDHCHIGVGAVINGGCRVEEATLIGSQATVIGGVHIAAGSIIGAGCVVTKDITEGGTYVGVPARKVQYA